MIKLNIKRNLLKLCAALRIGAGCTTSDNGVISILSSGSSMENPSSGGGVTWVTAPASSTASGTQGEIAYDSNYFYVAISNNVWRRTTLATW